MITIVLNCEWRDNANVLTGITAGLVHQCLVAKPPPVRDVAHVFEVCGRSHEEDVRGDRCHTQTAVTLEMAVVVFSAIGLQNDEGLRPREGGRACSIR